MDDEQRHVLQENEDPCCALRKGASLENNVAPRGPRETPRKMGVGFLFLFLCFFGMGSPGRRFLSKLVVSWLMCFIGFRRHHQDMIDCAVPIRFACCMNRLEKAWNRHSDSFARLFVDQFFSMLRKWSVEQEIIRTLQGGSLCLFFASR
jgi:hypothetical protein